MTRSARVLKVLGVLALLAFAWPAVDRMDVENGSRRVVGVGLVPWLEVERTRTSEASQDGVRVQTGADAIEIELVDSVFALGLAGILAISIGTRLGRRPAPARGGPAGSAVG